MEKAGGHTLKMHVSQTNNELILRLAINPKLYATSTFTDKRTAINAVKENLRYNANEIAEWLKSNLTTPKGFECMHKHSLGNGLFKGKKNIIDGLLQSRIVLEKDKKQNIGFKILTAFPTID